MHEFLSSSSPKCQDSKIGLHTNLLSTVAFFLKVQLWKQDKCPFTRGEWKKQTEVLLIQRDRVQPQKQQITLKCDMNESQRHYVEWVFLKLDTQEKTYQLLHLCEIQHAVLIHGNEK